MAAILSPPPVMPVIEEITPTSNVSCAAVCYLCSGPAHRECEACERAVCMAHHRIYEGWCLVERDYCPACYREKQAFYEHIKALTRARFYG